MEIKLLTSPRLAALASIFIASSIVGLLLWRDNYPIEDWAAFGFIWTLALIVSTKIITYLFVRFSKQCMLPAKPLIEQLKTRPTGHPQRIVEAITAILLASTLIAAVFGCSLTIAYQAVSLAGGPMVSPWFVTVSSVMLIYGVSAQITFLLTSYALCKLLVKVLESRRSRRRWSIREAVSTFATFTGRLGEAHFF